MAKNTILLNAAGKETTKKENAYARVVTDSKKGSFDAFIDSLPTGSAEALLKGIEDLLGPWMEVRANMPQDPAEGSEVVLSSDNTHFSVKAPTTSLSPEHLQAIDSNWSAFMKQFEPQQPQPAPSTRNNGQQNGNNGQQNGNNGQQNENNGQQNGNNGQQQDQDDDSDEEFDICSATVEQTLAHNRKRNPFLSELNC